MTLRVMPDKGYQLFDNASFVQNSTVATDTETMILATAVAQVDPLCNAVVFQGTVYFIPGTGCTGVIFRLKEGYGTAGSTDWEPAGYGPPAGIAVTAGVVNAVPLSGVVNPQWQQQAGGGQYSLTLEQQGTSVTGDATVLNASLALWQATWWDTEPSS